MSSNDVVLITGANTGLGFQIVRSLCDSKAAYNLVLGGRSLSKVEEAIKSATADFPSSSSKLSAVQVDIDDDESIRRAFEEIKSEFGRLDVLVNNAGAQFDQQLVAGKMSMREMWNASWTTNVTGTQIMTHTFAPLLLASKNPRLIFMASGTSTLAGSENMDLVVNHYPPAGWPKKAFAVPAYRSAKTGLNMCMREWHRMLHEDGVKVWATSPGFLATGLGGDPEHLKKIGAQDPEVAGTFIRSVIEGQRDADVGKVILAGKVQPW